MLKKMLFIGTGGFIGASFRFLIGGCVQRSFPKSFFPWGTCVVNILGCLLIGFLMGLANTRQMFSSEFRMLIFIGVLGSFTTFSTFIYESMTLLRDNQYLLTALNIGGQVLIGLLAAFIGIYLSRLF